MFFFFQAEDGIRDDLVTGVQTCALPYPRREKPRPKTQMQPESMQLSSFDLSPQSIFGSDKEARTVTYSGTTRKSYSCSRRFGKIRSVRCLSQTATSSWPRVSRPAPT